MIFKSLALSMLPTIIITQTKRIDRFEALLTKKGLTKSKVRRVLGIELRNKLLRIEGKDAP